MVRVQNVRIYREMVFVLLIVRVGHGGFIVHTSHPIDRVSLKEQGIGQAGFARGAMPNECNVPDVLDQVLDGHETASDWERCQCAWPLNLRARLWLAANS